MIKLQLLLGSASYGLQTQTSDTDIYIVGSGAYMVPDGNKPHIMRESKELYIQKATLEYKKHPLYLQTLFPAEFFIETEASKYILETREDVIRAQLKAVYESHITIGNKLLELSEYLYKTEPKRIAYGTMFLDTVYRYAQGRPEEDFKQWLLDVRAVKIPLDEILLMSDEKIKLANSVLKFYEHEPNINYLDNWKSEIFELLSE